MSKDYMGIVGADSHDNKNNQDYEYGQKMSWDDVVKMIGSAVDVAYKQGWDEAYKICKKNTEEAYMGMLQQIDGLRDEVDNAVNGLKQIADKVPAEVWESLTGGHTLIDKMKEQLIELRCMMHTPGADTQVMGMFNDMTKGGE